MALREILGERARQRTYEVPAPVLPQVHFVDADFQQVARFRALDCDGTGQDVSRLHPFGPRVDVVKLRRHMEALAGQHVLGA